MDGSWHVLLSLCCLVIKPRLCRSFFMGQVVSPFFKVTRIVGLLFFRWWKCGINKICEILLADTYVSCIAAHTNCRDIPTYFRNEKKRKESCTYKTKLVKCWNFCWLTLLSQKKDFSGMFDLSIAIIEAWPMLCFCQIHNKKQYAFVRIQRMSLLYLVPQHKSEVKLEWKWPNGLVFGSLGAPPLQQTGGCTELSPAH